MREEEPLAWSARIDVVLNKDSGKYWLLLRLRGSVGDDLRYMSVPVPKAALAEALERASELEKKGYREEAVSLE